MMSTPSSIQYDAVVIGADQNGLTAASLLGKKGKKVLVVESRSRVGGLAGKEEFAPGFYHEGFYQDSGQVRLDIVKLLELERHGLVLRQQEHPVVSVDDQGEILALFSDPKKSFAEIEKFSHKDTRQYALFCEFFSKVEGWLGYVLSSPAPSLKPKEMSDIFHLAQAGVKLRALGKKQMLEIFRILPMCSADYLNEWFETPILKSALALSPLMGTFMGPWSPGSNLFLVTDRCNRHAGIENAGSGLIDALVGCAQANRVEIITDAQVAHISVENGKVDAVVLADGKEIQTNLVFSACDPKTTILNWLDPQVLTLTLSSRVQSLRSRGTTAWLNLAFKEPVSLPILERKQQQLGVMVDRLRLLGDLNSIEKNFDFMKYQEVSPHPYLDLHMVSPQVASIQVHFVPYDIHGGWSEERKNALLQSCLSRVKEFIPGLDSKLHAHQLLTPADLERQYGLWGGQIYQGEHALDQFFIRPTPETSQYHTPITGLYLCGSGVHPGGGLTGAPGFQAVQNI